MTDTVCMASFCAPTSQHRKMFVPLRTKQCTTPKSTVLIQPQAICSHMCSAVLFSLSVDQGPRITYELGEEHGVAVLSFGKRQNYMVSLLNFNFTPIFCFWNPFFFSAKKMMSCQGAGRQESLKYHNMQHILTCT